MVEQTLTTCLWFDTEAEDAARFYAAVFPGATLGDITRYPQGADRAGLALTVEFSLLGQQFVALNGGPGRPHTEAVSFQIPCRDQAEVDHYWEALTANGGQPGQCAWLTDRFGVSWQVIPEALPRLLADPDPQRAAAVGQAMGSMTKIVVADLEAAADRT